MDKQTRDQLLELNEKWKTASEEEKDKIVLEIQKLSNQQSSSEKIQQMEQMLESFKEKLELAKDSFSSESLQSYNEQLEVLKEELEDYKKNLFETLKSES